MSVDVPVFSPVKELVAATVAPGIGTLPDFTTPEIEKLWVGDAFCAQEFTATSSRRNTIWMAAFHIPKLKEAWASHVGSVGSLMPGRSEEKREPLIH